MVEVNIDEAMKWLTDEERAIVTNDTAPLWVPLVLLRKEATAVANSAERLDRHGFHLAVSISRVLDLHKVLAPWTSKATKKLLEVDGG